jgi:hypothetical protein
LGFQPRKYFCKNKHGVIAHEKGILEIWADDFKEVLNPLYMGIIPEEKVYFGPEHDIRDPVVQEFSAS